MEVNHIITGLGDHKHIERERVHRQLEDKLKSFRNAGVDEAEVRAFLDALEEGLRGLLASHDTWEQRQGGLLGSKALIAHCRETRSPHLDFELHAQHACMQLLEDDEVRVRLAVGDCLHELSKHRGVSVYEACHETILLSINENFDREGEGSKAGGSAAPSLNGSRAPASACASRPNSRNSSVGDLIGMLLQDTYRVTKPGTGELRHGTEGWKSLETSMRALGQILSGCGEAIRPYLTEPLRELLCSAQHHPNRFVREGGHYATVTLSKVLAGDELAAVGEPIAERLADGLSDNWSQVRFAASVATRAFMQGVPPEHQQTFLPTLLPPMCLNRYHQAEGVRSYSQETWRLVMGQSGREKVAANINQVVFYYIAQSKANDHGVREASCTCIAELMEKVDRDAVAPHVPNLLHALIICFKDMGWPVRDAACTAAGRCILAYPDQAKPVVESELLALWKAHLEDNIPSVRCNSALAMVNLARAYPEPESLARLMTVIKELLPKARSQPPDPAVESRPGSNTAAAQRERDNDPVLHSVGASDMFSCTNLSTRFGKEYYIKSDGCMDYGFARDKEPWEASDGAVHLLREVSALSLGGTIEAVESQMELLADLASTRSFAKACHLRETIWKSLPTIGKNMGVKRFKRYLDLFLPVLFADLCCGHQLTEVAAEKCALDLAEMIGRAMFLGRLPEDQVTAFQRIQRGPF